jgi:hypothetical protein
MSNGKTKELIFKKFIQDQGQKEVVEKNIRDFTIQSKDYIYYADKLPNTKLTLHNKTIHICLYHIVTEFMKPFVIFLLCKNETNQLHFPKLAFNEQSVEDAMKKMETLLHKPKLEYKGYVEDGDDVYFIMEQVFPRPQMPMPMPMQWALSTELVNTKKVLNIDIAHSVTHFFLENIKLLFIYNKEGHQYECPSVAYCYKNIKSVAKIGLCREGPTASFGPYYYFDLDLKEKETKGIRFALFTGNQLVLLSDRPSDVEKKWLNGQYDSLIIKSTIVIKRYEQQALLSNTD